MRLYKKQRRAVFSKLPIDKLDEKCIYSSWFDEDEIFDALSNKEFKGMFIVCLEDRYIEYANLTEVSL